MKFLSHVQIKCFHQKHKKVERGIHPFCQSISQLKNKNQNSTLHLSIARTDHFSSLFILSAVFIETFIGHCVILIECLKKSFRLLRFSYFHKYKIQRNYLLSSSSILSLNASIMRFRYSVRSPFLLRISPYI